VPPPLPTIIITPPDRVTGPAALISPWRSLPAPVHSRVPAGTPAR